MKTKHRQALELLSLIEETSIPIKYTEYFKLFAHHGEYEQAEAERVEEHERYVQMYKKILNELLNESKKLWS